MKKVFIGLLILMVVVISGCMNPGASTEVYQIEYSACDSADQGGTCESKLPQLDIITANECCEKFDKCCMGGI